MTAWLWLPHLSGGGRSVLQNNRQAFVLRSALYSTGHGIWILHRPFPLKHTCWSGSSMKLEPVSLLSIFMGLISSFISSNVWKRNTQWCGETRAVKSEGAGSLINDSLMNCLCRWGQMLLPLVYQSVWMAGKNARIFPGVSRSLSFHRAEWPRSPWRTEVRTRPVRKWWAALRLTERCG